jgi:hypothetical protein
MITYKIITIPLTSLTGKGLVPSIGNYSKPSVISGFRRHVDDICALLGYYAALNGNPLPTFRDNLSVPPTRVKKSKKDKKLLDR